MGGRAEQVYVGAAAGLVGGVAVSPDGKFLAAAGERATLALFGSASGKLLRLEGHDPKASPVGAVSSVAFDPQGRRLFSGGNDDHIIRWSLPAGDKLDEWQALESVWALALSPDGTTLASGGTDGKITLWSVPDGKRIRTLEGHTGAIASPNGLAFSPDGSRLASTSLDKTARIWDCANGKTLWTLGGHNDNVKAVAFSPDGKRLATTSDDKQVILWDAATGRPLRQLRGHQNIVFGVTRRIYQDHEAGLWSVARHGDILYTAANDATVRRWSLATPDQWLWETGEPAISAAISPDGRMVAVRLESGALRLYGVPQGQVLSGTHGHRQPITRIAYNRDGSLLATGGVDSKAKLWRVEGAGDSVKLTLVQTFEDHRDVVYGVTFSPNGRTLATAKLRRQGRAVRRGERQGAFVRRPRG